MQVPNFLNHIRDNLLIVTPGDSGDIIICEKTITFTSEGITPHMFQHRLAKWAKSQRMRLYLLPELEKTIIPWGSTGMNRTGVFWNYPGCRKK